MDSAVPMAVTMRMIVMCVRCFRIAPILARKCHVHQAEHVKGGEEGSNDSNQPVCPTCLISPPNNFVFAEKACQWRNSSDGAGGDQHRCPGPGNFSPEPAHLAHVLFAADGMNHRPGCEEEQAFKEGMGHQVKDA